MAKNFSFKMGALVMLFAGGQFAKANTVESIFGEKWSIPDNIKRTALVIAQAECPDIVSEYGLSIVALVSRSESDFDKQVEIGTYTITYLSNYTYDYHPKTGKIVQTIDYTAPMLGAQDQVSKSVKVKTSCSP